MSNSWQWDGETGAVHWSDGDGAVRVSKYRGRAPRHVPQLQELEDFERASPFVLWDWSEYRVEFEGGAQAKDPDPSPGLSVEAPHPAVRLYQFQNRTGVATLDLCDRAPPLVVEVVSPKLCRSDDPLAYARAFRRLATEAQQRMASLPFDRSSSTSLATAEDPRATTPVFERQFLRWHAEEVQAAARALAANPFRALAREEVVTPIERARFVDARSVAWSIASSTRWVESDLGWFSTGGRRYLPGETLQLEPSETFDTHENRFVKRFLELLRETVVRALAAEPAPAFERLRETLDEALSWSWLSEVGPLVLVPVTSQVLHRQDGYRELFDLWPEFWLARTPFGGGLHRAIAARDVAKLYEYWCFFRLIHDLEPLLGRASLELCETEERLRGGAEARFGDHLLVYDVVGDSYSVELRPDFVLTGPRAGAGIALDAKFRVDGPTGEREVMDEDMHKMHAYRDALRLRAALVLYPGERAAFHELDRRPVDPRRCLAELLNDPGLQGVGVLPLAPTEEGAVTS